MDGLGQTTRARRRLLATMILLAAAALAVIVRLVILMVVIPAREPAEPLVLPEVERGAILDRRGRILAITTRHQLASCWAPGITEPAQTADLLAATLGMEAAQILEGWRRRPGYSVLKRRLTEAEAAEIARLKAEGRLAGIRLEAEYGRRYPEGPLASHLVGYVGVDNIGLDGIEYALNDELGPQPVGTDRQTVYGNQVYLTIDAALQHRVERVARAAFRDNRADSLMVLVMDADTAEALAWVSLPDFDPNEFQQPSPQVGRAALDDRPVTFAYEPGSVFKAFSMAALLELGTITPASRFLCTGSYELRLPDGGLIRIGCIGRHGEVDVRRILKLSCNAGACAAAETADNRSFAALLARFGFGAQTGVPLPGETAGILRPAADWSLRSRPTIAMGQEVSVSALQVAAAATVLTNDGMLLKPQVVSRIVAPDGAVVKEFARTERWRAISAGSARAVLAMLESGTEEGGTARRAAVAGVRISAKTGTAQVLDPATGAYSATDFVASLLGIFPTEDPRFIVYVVIQNPRGESYLGSAIAAPVFHDIALELLDAEGIPRSGVSVARHAGALSVPAAPVITVGETMPDLWGIPKRLLLPLLGRDDLEVVVRGSGSVVRQEPAPGAPLPRGTRIVLELE